MEARGPEGGGRGTRGAGRVTGCLLGLPQSLVALRRVQALQQRGPGAAPGAVPNPPAGGVAYTDRDRKILQLCGEDPVLRGGGDEEGGQGLTWRGGASAGARARGWGRRSPGWAGRWSVLGGA